ncbi:MAG: large subunit ribosomal protein L6 [Chloroflexi bacterium]|jgi:large subunit ribosomal protein L6|nr:MAG: large subunit ribosomal protein L6 [Chloroflexota bacterium]
MSRVGRLPIEIPSGVTVQVDGDRVAVKGPKGELSWSAPPTMAVSVDASSVTVTRPTDKKDMRAKHGLTRALINNMVIGVSQGFAKTLEIQGTGYRAEMTGKSLNLRVGFSHPVVIDPHEGITFQVEGPLVTVSGISKQAVGQQAAEIRKIRPPEPYKGKGIRYQGEWVRRKTGKSAAGA